MRPSFTFYVAATVLVADAAIIARDHWRCRVIFAAAKGDRNAGDAAQAVGAILSGVGSAKDATDDKKDAKKAE
ncbi:hypothetical protein N0V82_002228 [Gnomoniopsis sp. IMI 355080]|nr:hypothetical protein N0V82_002228 [Gnomoniopsis sp. IMI 355080]